MTISNRAKALTAGVLMIVAIILILLFLKRPAETVESTAPVVVEESEEVREERLVETTPVPLSEERQQEVSASTVAGIFVERFGSYSSESDLSNIEDILSLATATYQDELRALIEEVRRAGASDSYYGVTTRVIGKKMTDLDEAAGTASFDVLTQREESIGSVQETTVRYQTMRLELKQEEGVWKVVSATWL